MKLLSLKLAFVFLLSIAIASALSAKEASAQENWFSITDDSPWEIYTKTNLLTDAKSASATLNTTYNRYVRVSCDESSVSVKHGVGGPREEKIELLGKLTGRAISAGSSIELQIRGDKNPLIRVRGRVNSDGDIELTTGTAETIEALRVAQDTIVLGISDKPLVVFYNNSHSSASMLSAFKHCNLESQFPSLSPEGIVQSFLDDANKIFDDETDEASRKRENVETANLYRMAIEREARDSRARRHSSNFAPQVAACWPGVEDLPNAESIAISFKVELRQNGDVNRVTRIAPREAPDSNYALHTAIERAERAVWACEPYSMPKDEYADWKTIIVSF